MTIHNKKKINKEYESNRFFFKLTKLICTYCNKRRSCKDTIMHYLYSPKMKPITQCSILDLSTYCTSTVNHSNKITFQLSIIPQMFQRGTIILCNVKQIHIPHRLSGSGETFIKIMLMFEADTDDHDTAQVRDHNENQSN